MEETEFVNRLRKGEEAAFIQFVDDYKKKMISLCYSYTGDWQIAEDLSQEAFISFYQSINNFKGQSSLSTYLYRIAVNKCLTYKKKETLTNKLLSLIQNKEETLSYEDKDAVRQEINTLSKDIKTPIVLCYYVGLSHKEIAEVLNTTERAIEGRIYRGKAKLKEKLEKEEVHLWQ